MLHERVESVLGKVAELQFFHHGPSLTTPARPGAKERGTAAPRQFVQIPGSFVKEN
jgi:hypothetical protein